MRQDRLVSRWLSFCCRTRDAEESGSQARWEQSAQGVRVDGLEWLSYRCVGGGCVECALEKKREGEFD